MKRALYMGNQTIAIEPCEPLAPPPGEVRLKVSHCGICGTDVHVFHGKMDKRVRIPQPIGHEMSGTIDAVGEGVTWRVGERVTVRPLDPCGDCPACHAGHRHICMKLKFIGIDTPGAMQGWWNVPAHTLHRIPDSLDMKTAALLEPLAVACHDVRLSGLQAGEHAVIIGGGPIGILIALVARETGADVLVLEINPSRVELARQLGIEVLNPLEHDPEVAVNQRTGGAGADVVFEVSASQPGITLMTKLARTRGRIVLVGICSEPPRVDLFRFFWRELKLIGARVYEPEDFDQAIALAAAGKMPLERLITCCLPLPKLQEGFSLIDSGADVMKIVIDCQA